MQCPYYHLDMIMYIYRISSFADLDEVNFKHWHVIENTLSCPAVCEVPFKGIKPVHCTASHCGLSSAVTWIHYSFL